MKILEIKQHLSNSFHKRTKRIRQLSKRELLRKVEFEFIWLFSYILTVSMSLWFRFGLIIGRHRERTTKIKKTLTDKNTVSVIKT